LTDGSAGKGNIIIPEELWSEAVKIVAKETEESKESEEPKVHTFTMEADEIAALTDYFKSIFKNIGLEPTDIETILNSSKWEKCAKFLINMLIIELQSDKNISTVIYKYIKLFKDSENNNKELLKSFTLINNLLEKQTDELDTLKTANTLLNRKLSDCMKRIEELLAENTHYKSAYDSLLSLIGSSEGASGEAAGGASGGDVKGASGGAAGSSKKSRKQSKKEPQIKKEAPLKDDMHTILCELEELKKVNAELTAQNERLNSSEQKRKELDALISELKKENASIQKRLAENSVQREDSARVKKELARIKVEQKKDLAERAKVQDELAKVQAKLAQVQEERAPIQDELAKVQTELGKVQTELEKVQAESARVQAESALVKSESAQVQAEREKVQAEREKVQAKLAQVQAELARVQAALKKAKTKVAKGKEDYAKLQEKFKTEYEKFEFDYNQVQKAREFYTSEFARFNVEYESLKAQLEMKDSQYAVKLRTLSDTFLTVKQMLEEQYTEALRRNKLAYRYNLQIICKEESNKIQTIKAELTSENTTSTFAEVMMRTLLNTLIEIITKKKIKLEELSDKIIFDIGLYNSLHELNLTVDELPDHIKSEIEKIKAFNDSASSGGAGVAVGGCAGSGISAEGIDASISASAEGNEDSSSNATGDMSGPSAQLLPVAEN
jgi:DNA repair exonuclease SbcCD ATPase subunit